jgi:hypothetical protein
MQKEFNCKIDLEKSKNRFFLSLYNLFPKNSRGGKARILFSVLQNPLTESLAAIEPNAETRARAAPALCREKVPSMLDEMLAGGAPGVPTGFALAAHPSSEGVQDHVQTAALETPSRPRDAIAIPDLESGNAVERSDEVLTSDLVAGRLDFASPSRAADDGPRMRARVAAPQASSNPRGAVITTAILVYCHEDIMKQGFRKAVFLHNKVNRTTLNSALLKLKGDLEMRVVKRAAVAARDDPTSPDHEGVLLELGPFKEFWPVELAQPGAAKLPPPSRKNGAENYLGSGAKQADFLPILDEMVGTQTLEPQTLNSELNLHP